MELMPPAVQMQSPNHWITREVSYLIVVLIYTSLKTIVLSIISCADISFGEMFIKTLCLFLKLGCLFYCCIEEVFMCQGPAPADPGYSKERWLGDLSNVN